MSKYATFLESLSHSRAKGRTFKLALILPIAILAFLIFQGFSSFTAVDFDLSGSLLLGGFLLTTASYVSFRTSLSLAYVLMVITIPWCLVSAAADLLLLLGNLGNCTSNLYELNGCMGYMSVYLSPMAIGALITVVAYFFAPKSLRSLSIIPLTKADLVICLLPMVLWFAIKSGMKFPAFLDPGASSINMLFILLAALASTWNRMSFSEVLTNAGIATALCSIVMVTIGYYTVMSERPQIGPFLAIGFLGTIYGVFTFFFAFFLSLLEGSTEEINFSTKNWHLVEGFAFLIFMIYGPFGMWDQILLNMEIDGNFP